VARSHAGVLIGSPSRPSSYLRRTAQNLLGIG
jgi:hypothetical protein